MDDRRLLRTGWARFVLLGFVLQMIVMWQLPAFAGTSDYPMEWRILWKPTHGSVTTGSGTTWERSVDESFSWDDWVSLSRVDAPRTPYKWGTYEHEIRFFPDNNGRRWCDPAHGVNNVFLDLFHGYRDIIDVDENEFTWGMQTWGLVEDHKYDIYFECKRTTPGGPSSNEYNLTGQLGHCHFADNCSSINTYADETTRLNPRIQGNAPETEIFKTTFSGNKSFETTLDPWNVFDGSMSRVCNNPNPYHGSCYVFVRADSGGVRPRITYRHDPSPSAAGTASVFNEFVVRCPSAWNSSGCPMRVRVEGFDSRGNSTSEAIGAWMTIPRDDRWYLIPSLKTGAFPSGTVFWKFKLEGGYGVTFHADYNAQYWHLPR